MSDTHDGPDTQLAEREFAPSGEIMSSLARSELDVQITTAKTFPRSLQKFMDAALSMATINQEIAGDCMYALPRGGKTIEGPSVRLAEIVASAWGNLHAATKITGDDGKFIIAQAVVWDLERNVRLGFEVRRRITDKGGRRYNDDMIGTTASAAMSIALRNAIFRIVPNAFTQTIYQKCRLVAVGDEKTLSARRTEMLAHFQKLGVKPERLFAVVGAKTELEIDLERLATLRGIATAIKSGETSIDDAFPDPTGAQEAADKKLLTTGDKAADLTAELKAKKDAAVPATPDPTPEQKARKGKTSSLPGITAPEPE